MRILTFDIEEWFHILDCNQYEDETAWLHMESRLDANLERVLDIITESRASATFFCLGWTAAVYPSAIRKISDAGHEVACHSHLHRLAYQQTPTEFREDLRDAKNAIFAATGTFPTKYRVPGFSLTTESLWVLEILHEEGFSVDCSIFPARRAHGGLPQFPTSQPCWLITENGHALKEFPLNTRSFFGTEYVFSGGGYFRLLPYFILRRLFADSNYVMTYFHPRDFDAEQPRLGGLGATRRIKSYVGLKTAEKKLRKMLSEFDFMDVGSAVQQIDWDSVPVFQAKGTHFKLIG